MTDLASWKDSIRLAVLPKKLYLAYQATRAGRRGEPELNLLQFVVPRERNAIDAGAHKGVYSWYLAKLCTEIYAFEPNPIMFAYLRNAVPANVRCYNAALSAAAGKTTLHVPTSRSQIHHTRGSLLQVEGATGHASVDVDAHTIDQHNFCNVGFIKLDLEGSELDALRGGVQLIRRDRPVILAEATGIAGSCPVELTRFLRDLDYVPLVYRDHRLIHFGDKAGQHITHNCFYFPDESQLIDTADAAH